MAALTEFGLIARYFTHASGERRGVGDDCALIDVGDQTLALTSDMLLEDVHFLTGADAEALGHKALAVNLSDLAAAGARPRCFLLDLALPAVDESWLAGFSRGMMDLARHHACALIGGDTTRSPVWPPIAASRHASMHQAGVLPWRVQAGPIVIAVTAIGEVPAAFSRGRDGARPGDDLWVSGFLGDAPWALLWRRHARGEGPAPVALAPGVPAPWQSDSSGHGSSGWREACLRMDRPIPRVELGLALRGIATAAIDVSDGLVGDLGHLLDRSGVGCELHWRRVPCSPWVQTLPLRLRQSCVLAGGDAYELLFTAAPEHRSRIESLATRAVPLTHIGRVRAQPGLEWVDDLGPVDERPLPGLRAFDHFPEDARHDHQQ